jgi:hypothetical protein
MFANFDEKQIKKIDFTINQKESYLLNIPHLSRFENLETLVLYNMHFDINEDFISIANNCNKLKLLSIIA